MKGFGRVVMLRSQVFIIRCLCIIKKKNENNTELLWAVADNLITHCFIYIYIYRRMGAG